MSDIVLEFGGETFTFSPTDFCRIFALVINQKAKSGEQISLRFQQDWQDYVDGDGDFCLNAKELRSVLDGLGIVVDIPKGKKNEPNNGNIVIGGSVHGANLSTGSGNNISNTLPNGLELTTIITGNGIYVGPPK